MARHTKAQKVKYQLREIANDLISNGEPTVNSSKVVEIFLLKNLTMTEKEKTEIFGIGLKVVAGQIGSTSRINKNQYELALDNNVREFTRISKKNGNKVVSSLIRTLDLSPDVYFNQPVRVVVDRSETKKSFKDELETNMKKMQDLGLNSERYEEFLKRKE
jgi:hypothetical protein